VKRFTETKKWNNPWFRKLTPELKCFWLYLCDECDCAGVIKPDFELASFIIGFQVTEADLASFEHRVEPLKDGYFWLTTFCPFQYKTLHPDCAPQRRVLDILDQHGLLARVNGRKRKHLSNNDAA
jgi:hypothetical protein